MKNDWTEQFDASVGLTFSLRAFERYRTNGILMAEIRAVPGIRGSCQAFLELTEGKVVACYLIDSTGKRHPIMKDLLIKLEQAKGSFSWTFYEVPAALFQEQAGTPSVSQVPRFPVPVCLKDRLDARHIRQWTPEQQRYLHMVFSAINGKRGINEIKEQLSLPSTLVDEAIRILLSLEAIAMQ